MNYTKSRLKELIMEVAKEHSLDYGPGGAPSHLHEIHDLSSPDEEEIAEWTGMIEDDVLALRETLNNVPKEILSSEHEELLDLLNRLVGESGEPFGDDEEEEEDIDIDIEDF